MTQQKNIILASASPRRKELLSQIGIIPVIEPSSIEEKITTSDPAQVVMELARQKAEDVAGRGHEKDLVIGSDTVVAIDGKILGKPGSPEEAREMITLLSGNVHQVYTGVAIVTNRKTTTFFEETRVYVYPMTTDEIYDYVECGESMDKAGAYGIQGKFAAFIKGIEGSYTNVMGLPLGRLYQEIKKIGGCYD